MRLIDADALIEDLSNNYLVKNDGTWNDAMDRAVELTKTAPKAGEWIPCSERLPQTNGVYQVKTVVYEGYFKNYIVTCAYFDGQNTWHNDNRVNHGRPYMIGVVAWCPLLEPYKEGE